MGSPLVYRQPPVRSAPEQVGRGDIFGGSGERMREPTGGQQRCGNEFRAEPGVGLPPIAVERECRDGFEIVRLAVSRK
jgi:hypothetical protein